MNKQEGFAILFLTSIFTFLIGLFGLFWFLGSHLSTDSQVIHLCRQTLLEYQLRSGQKIQLLLELNQKILQLRFEKKMAQASLAAALAAGQAPAAAAARSWLSRIHSLQIGLKIQQEMLIAQSMFEKKKGQLIFAQRIRKLKPFQHHDIKSTIGIAAASRPQISVRPVEASEPPPTYELQESFREIQSVSLFWSQRTETTDTGVKKWSPPPMIRPRGCSASLSFEAGKFQPILIEAKFSSKPSLSRL